MNGPQKPRLYRELIDEVVRVCKEGQGQIGAMRAREGVWNPNATPDFIPEQHQINLLLKRLSPEERKGVNENVTSSGSESACPSMCLPHDAVG